VQVTRCLRSELEAQIGSADILVPLMAALDADLLRRAGRAKLVLQFGVGLEGVDIPAVGSIVAGSSLENGNDGGRGVRCLILLGHFRKAASA